MRDGKFIPAGLDALGMLSQSIAIDPDDPFVDMSIEGARMDEMWDKIDVSPIEIDGEKHLLLRVPLVMDLTLPAMTLRDFPNLRDNRFRTLRKLLLEKAMMDIDELLVMVALKMEDLNTIDHVLGVQE